MPLDADAALTIPAGAYKIPWGHFHWLMFHTQTTTIVNRHQDIGRSGQTKPPLKLSISSSGHRFETLRNI
jgi:hypothetical protein